MSTTCTDLLGMSRGIETVGDRITEWVRRFSAKDLARITGAELRTANSWLQGNRPSGPHFDRLVARWGRPFVDFVYGPILAADALDLEGRFEAMEAELHILKRETKALTHALARTDSRPLARVARDDDHLQNGGRGGVGEEERDVAPGHGAALARAGRTAVALLVGAVIATLLLADLPDHARLRESKGGARTVAAKVIGKIAA